MKTYFRNHPMVAMCIAMLVAAVATQWILNPKSGPFSALTWANALTIGAVLLIMVAGIAILGLVLAALATIRAARRPPLTVLREL